MKKLEEVQRNRRTVWEGGEDTPANHRPEEGVMCHETISENERKRWKETAECCKREQDQGGGLLRSRRCQMIRRWRLAEIVWTCPEQKRDRLGLEVVAGRRSGGGGERGCVNVEKIVLTKPSLLLLFCHFCPTAINLPLLQLLSASVCSFWILFPRATFLGPPGTLQTKSTDWLWDLENKAYERLEKYML